MLMVVVRESPVLLSRPVLRPEEMLRLPTRLPNILLAATAIVYGGARFVPDQRPGPVLSSAIEFVSAKPRVADSAGTNELIVRTHAALESIGASVRQLSHPRALEKAFLGYFAFKAAHPDDVKKPYLYFVDYGLPSTTPRGYVFDMRSLRIVDGPFMVAHGRGSSNVQYGVPTRFSNASGSNATSLGLYLAKETYTFRGKTAGRKYSSVGLRLEGVSEGFNDNALARGVVAHGAPYVTPTRAGRSEGCPAIEQSRAKQLLPKLANGAMVFLFAPDAEWLSSDRWLTAAE
jgi:hypothetical protein